MFKHDQVRQQKMYTKNLITVDFKTINNVKQYILTKIAY